MHEHFSNQFQPMYQYYCSLCCGVCGGTSLLPGEGVLGAGVSGFQAKSLIPGHGVPRCMSTPPGLAWGGFRNAWYAVCGYVPTSRTLPPLGTYPPRYRYLSVPTPQGTYPHCV